MLSPSHFMTHILSPRKATSDKSTNGVIKDLCNLCKVERQADLSFPTRMRLIVTDPLVASQSSFAACLVGLGADQRGPGKEVNSYWHSTMSNQVTLGCCFHVGSLHSAHILICAKQLPNYFLSF